MTNTKGEGSGGDPFWEKSERLLLTALIAYLHYEAPVEEQNFATLLEMLNTMQVLEDDEEYQNPVDLLFEELGKKKPNSFAVRQYKLYKLAAGKTAKSILISCGARLAPFDIQELRNLTMYDELALDTLGDKKTALFLIYYPHLSSAPFAVLECTATNAPNERKMAHPINLSLITAASTARCSVGKNAISTSRFRKKFSTTLWWKSSSSWSATPSLPL